jgi:hypothetical protein
MNNEEQPIICDLTIFPAATRQQMAAAVPDLFKRVQTVREMSDGYTFQFPNEPGLLITLANFIEHERQCCPFYHFALEADPNGGPFWLRMTGGEGVKAFMQTVWTNLPEAVGNLIQTAPEDDLDEIIVQAAPTLAAVMEKTRTVYPND